LENAEECFPGILCIIGSFAGPPEVQLRVPGAYDTWGPGRHGFRRMSATARGRPRWSVSSSLGRSSKGTPSASQRRRILPRNTSAGVSPASFRCIDALSSSLSSRRIIVLIFRRLPLLLPAPTRALRCPRSRWPWLRG
jgi:hypothetical protein